MGNERVGTPAGLRLMSAMGARHPLLCLFSNTNWSAGTAIDCHFEIAGAIKQKLLSGQKSDVVILPVPYLEELSKARLLVPGSVKSVMRPLLAAFVRTGVKKPGVRTVDELKDALLSAESFCYTNPMHGGVSGTTVRMILERLNIARQMEGKTTLGAPGAQPTQLVAAGRVQLGIVQLSEIIDVNEIEVAGVIPECFQPDLDFAAAVLKGSDSLDSARSLVAQLCTSAAREVFTRCGMRSAGHGQE